MRILLDYLMQLEVSLAIEKVHVLTLFQKISLLIIFYQFLIPCDILFK